MFGTAVAGLFFYYGCSEIGHLLFSASRKFSVGYIDMRAGYFVKGCPLLSRKQLLVIREFSGREQYSIVVVLLETEFSKVV
ncbi:MAG: hypothetical protein Pars92KO_33190 [Parasphingorhabdus sp.]